MIECRNGKALHNRDTYQHIANLYTDQCQKWLGHKVFFLTYRMKKETRKKRLEMLGKFVDTTLSLGVSFERYMEAQFEILVPYLKKQHPGSNFPPAFGALISEKAVNRFKKYAEKVDVVGVEVYRAFELDIRRALRSSIERFHDKTKEIREKKQITHKLEIMARAGLVSNIFVYCSPLVEKSESEFLLNMQYEVSKRLTKEQKQMVEKVKKELGRESDAKEVI